MHNILSFPYNACKIDFYKKIIYCAFDTITVMYYSKSMAGKVTIQDIANELGLSRNTVSKAINSTGIIADQTRETILKKAAEMGYKLFAQPESGGPEKERKELVLLTASALGASHFSAKMMDEMQEEASQMGYGFTIYRVMPQELEDLTLPANFDLQRAAGIFCVEMFHGAYSAMLCTLGLPVVFIDTAVTFEDKALPADVLLMENRSGIYTFVKEMAARGKSEIAFVGEALHCMSFYERYDAYMGALRLFSLPYRPEYCITGTSRGQDYPPHESYLAYLEESFRKWDKLPSVTICANDFVAMDVLHVFRKLGISVPDDMYLCGFDDSPESRLVSPALTTIRIHGKAMGREAIRLLFSRIKEPGLEFRTVYSGTSLIYRGSTGD